MTTSQVNLSNSIIEIKDARPARKKILVAITVLLSIGLLVSGFMNAPWVVPLTFFVLILCSLYPVEKKVDNQKALINSN